MRTPYSVQEQCKLSSSIQMGTWSLLAGQSALWSVKHHIDIPIQEFISSYNFALKMLLRSDDKHGTNALDSIQSGKVILSYVKDKDTLGS